MPSEPAAGGQESDNTSTSGARQGITLDFMPRTGRQRLVILTIIAVLAVYMAASILAH